MKNYITKLSILFVFGLIGIGLSNQGNDDPANLNDPLIVYGNPQPTDATYDILRNHNIDSLINGAPFNYGAVWTGSNYIVSRFNANMFYRMRANWTFRDSIAVSGATWGADGFKDMVFAKGFLWGVKSSLLTTTGTNIIYKVDTTLMSQVGTITLPAGINPLAIDYDAVRNGFWVSTANFGGVLRCYDTAGVAIVGTDIPTVAGGFYGVAYDNATAGGPYLWLHKNLVPANPTQTMLVRFRVSGSPVRLDSGTKTIPLMTAVTGGGLSFSSTLIPGKTVLVAVTQGSPDRLVVFEAGSSSVVVQNFALRLPTPGANTNYVSIPHQPSMVGFNNITIEAWVKPGGTTTANTVLNKGAASFDYQFGINATTANPFFRAQGIVALASTMTIAPNVWTHIAVTYDGTTARFYKDGQLGFSLAQVMPLGSSANEMRIGRGNNDAGSGNIEELRLWSVARTQGQIDTNKCRKYPGTFTGTIGLKSVWHFDSSYVDSVSNYNGTPLGSVGFDTVSFPLPGASCILVGIQQSVNEIPGTYSLEQNYPNPFNPATTIKFSIPKDNFVEIKLYDILGKEIQNILSEPLEAGKYSVNFNANALPTGVYFYKITAGDFSDTKKMILAK